MNEHNNREENQTPKQAVSGHVEPVVSWDLERMMKAVNSPSVTMPENIKDYGGFNKWVNSLADDDFKSN